MFENKGCCYPEEVIIKKDHKLLFRNKGDRDETEFQEKVQPEFHWELSGKKMEELNNRLGSCPSLYLSVCLLMDARAASVSWLL